MNQPDDDSIFTNYQKFRQGLRNGALPRFDEDTLLDIFDIAGDNNDRHIQLEVLLVAARLYPESSEFKLKKGVFCSYIDIPTLHSFIETNIEGTGLGWDFLRITDSGLKGDDAIPVIQTILDNTPSLSDEEIIRLMDLMRDTLCESWFIQNYRKFEAKADYPDTLLYETAILALDAALPDQAEPILERLTQLDAFRCENWILLAECRTKLSKFSQARQAIEYARAIAPENPDIDLNEANLLMADPIGDDDLRRALTLYLNVNNRQPGNQDIVANIITLMSTLNLTAEYREFCRNTLLADPTDLNILVQFASDSTPDKIIPYVEAYIRNSPPETLRDTFSPQALKAYSEIAPAIVAAYGAITPRQILLAPDTALPYLSSLNTLGLHEQIASIWLGNHIDPDIAALPPVTLIIAIALMRTHRFKECLQCISHVASPTISTASPTLISSHTNQIGTAYLLNQISRIALNNDTEAADKWPQTTILTRNNGQNN